MNLHNEIPGMVMQGAWLDKQSMESPASPNYHDFLMELKLPRSEERNGDGSISVCLHKNT